MGIYKNIFNFKTKHKMGFMQSEIETLVKLYPNINIDKFNKAIGVVTCRIIDGDTIIYNHDVEKAWRKITTNRDSLGLWD